MLDRLSPQVAPLYVVPDESEKNGVIFFPSPPQKKSGMLRPVGLFVRLLASLGPFERPKRSAVQRTGKLFAEKVGDNALAPPTSPCRPHTLLRCLQVLQTPPWNTITF